MYMGKRSDRECMFLQPRSFPDNCVRVLHAVHGCKHQSTCQYMILLESCTKCRFYAEQLKGDVYSDWGFTRAVQLNPLPTNDAYMRHELHKPIRIYMGV